MKKILTILIISLVALIPAYNVNAKNDKVILNVFYAEWCHNCTNLHEYLDELEKDKDYNDMFKIVYYRLDNEAQYGKNDKMQENTDLYLKVGQHLGYQGGSIPFYVVGDKYEVGFSKTETPDIIKKMIKDAYFDKKYSDVVSKIKSNEIKVEITTAKPDSNKNDKEETDEKDESNLEEKNRKTTTYIGIGVIVLTFVALIAIVVINILKK